MAKKRKEIIRVKRYVNVTKTVVKKPKDYSSSSENKETSSIIGEFGGLKFQVKIDKNGNPNILTMSDVSQEVSSNWVDHAVIGRKFPKSEFVGANNRTFSMTVVVDRLLGYKPHSIMHKMNKFCETGQVSTLKIGSHKIGNKWKITNISEPFDRIWKNGQLTKATLTIELTTYS